MPRSAATVFSFLFRKRVFHVLSHFFFPSSGLLSIDIQSQSFSSLKKKKPGGHAQIAAKSDINKNIYIYIYICISIYASALWTPQEIGAHVLTRPLPPSTALCSHFFFFWFLKVKKRSKDDAEPNRDTQKRTTRRIVTGMKKMGARIEFKKKNGKQSKCQGAHGQDICLFFFLFNWGKKEHLAL